LAPETFTPYWIKATSRPAWIALSLPDRERRQPRGSSSRMSTSLYRRILRMSPDHRNSASFSGLNDQGSFDAIMQFIRSHHDQYDKVHWRLPPTSPFMTDSLIRIEVGIRPKMMLKLVDLKGAIERRRWPRSSRRNQPAGQRR
jgi:hypothetical protein